MNLPIERIRTDGGTQPRAEIDMFTVEEYAEAMRVGATFPPVTVFFDGSDYWLADGFHRLQAAHKNGGTDIEADIRQGTRRDAIFFSVSANTTHGLRRSNADKRRAVMTLLHDLEWCKESDRDMARRCGVDHVTVGKYRSELSGEVHQIGRNATASPMRRARSTSKPRRVRRGSTVYTMDTANIGSKTNGQSQAEADREDVQTTLAGAGITGDDADIRRSQIRSAWSSARSHARNNWLVLDAAEVAATLDDGGRVLSQQFADDVRGWLAAFDRALTRGFYVVGGTDAS